MERILDDARIAAIMMASEGIGYEKGRDVAEAEHEETLKAIGEWLREKGFPRYGKEGALTVVIDAEEFGSLKRGEMPKKLEEKKR
jgi:hypothetical protein